MTSIKQKQFFIVLLGLIFVSMLILNFLTPLEADDYQYMFSFATGQRLTIIDQWVPSALAHYGSMNGRMVTNGIFSHMAAYMGKMVFNFFNAAAYLVFLLGAYKLARSENN